MELKNRFTKANKLQLLLLSPQDSGAVGRNKRELFRFTIFRSTTLVAAFLMALAPLFGHNSNATTIASISAPERVPWYGLALSLAAAVVILRVYFGTRDLSEYAAQSTKKLYRVSAVISIWLRSVVLTAAFFIVACILGWLLLDVQTISLPRILEGSVNPTSLIHPLSPSQLAVTQVFISMLILVHLPTGEVFRGLPLGPVFWFWSFLVMAVVSLAYTIFQIWQRQFDGGTHVALSISIGAFLFWICFQFVLRLRGRGDAGFTNSLAGAAMLFVPALILGSKQPAIPFFVCLFGIVIASLRSILIVRDDESEEETETAYMASSREQQ